MNSSSMLIEPVTELKYENELIRASAGTGKTFHLSNRYLRLVLNDVPVQQILATTFTRQAAREILDRILFRLAAAAASERAASELALALGLTELSRTRCVQKLRELTNALPQLRVSTLDAFFVQIAQAFSLEIGLPPGWRIIEETEETSIRAQAIDQYLAVGKPERVVKLMHLLSKGKAERSVSRLITDTVVDLHGLYLDSEFRAWKRLPQSKPLDDAELQEAVNALAECDISQFDVTKAFISAKDSDSKRATAGQWDSFLQSGIAGNLVKEMHTYGNGKKNVIPDELEALYQPLIDHALAMLRNQIAIQTESTYALLHGFDSQYRQIKSDTRSLRFDDVNRSLLSFVNAHAFRQIAFRMNSRINHLLLDEFQDTSRDQWQVIRPFAQHVANDASRSFFCVGDIKQAIYGWRGGDADILDQLDQQLPDVDSLELSASYRSSPVVIDFVNRVNEGLTKHAGLNNDEQKAVENWCSTFPTHATARTELPGHVTIETARSAQNDEEIQNDLVLDRCAERVAELVRKCPHATIAVLTRSNNSVAKTIFRLQQYGVGASELGGNPLTDSAAVQIVLSRLKLADHPGDSVAYFHLQHSPWANNLKVDQETMSAFTLSERTRRELADYGYGDTVQRWAGQLRPFCNDREWRRLRQLVEMAFVYQQKSEKPIQLGFSAQRRVRLRTREFIRQVETQRIADPSTDQVSVMTIHKSKGLQFDAVFVVELDKSKRQTPKCLASRNSPFDEIDQVIRYIPSGILERFPANIRKLHRDSSQANFREDLCVLYVALTRAIHALHLIVAPSKPDAKGFNVPKTSAGLVRAAVESTGKLNELTVIHESGNADWYEWINANSALSGTINVSREDRDDDGERLRRRVKLRASQAKAVAGLSPSSREGGGRVRLSDRLSLESSSAMRYGTIVHAWFEQIEWLDEFDMEGQVDQMRRIARQMGLAANQIDESLSRFRETIQLPSIRALLSRQRYGESQVASTLGMAISEIVDRVEVKNEQAISAVIDGQMTSGFIDRLVLVRDVEGRPVAAEIIDYKTDAVGDGVPVELSQKVSFYRPQLNAYKLAVTKMVNLPADRVQCCLVFVKTGSVVPVPTASDQGE